MFKKILFPTNNSTESEKSFDYVIDIAKKFNSEVIVFYSYEFTEDIISKFLGSYEVNDEIENEILFTYQSILEEIKNVLLDKGIKAKVLIGKGKAGIAITEAINSEDCDTVIMGRRNLSNTKSYLLGSVSNYVIHHAKCPVLVID